MWLIISLSWSMWAPSAYKVPSASKVISCRPCAEACTYSKPLSGLSTTIEASLSHRSLRQLLASKVRDSLACLARKGKGKRFGNRVGKSAAGRWVGKRAGESAGCYLCQIQNMPELCKIGRDVAPPRESKKLVILTKGVHQSDWCEEGAH